MKRNAWIVFACCSVFATAAQADLFFGTDGSIDGSLCVGDRCVTNESFNGTTLKLKSNTISIDFIDTSLGQGVTSNDWSLAVNTFGNSIAITDQETGDTPFFLFAGAPSAALVIGPTGNLGLNASAPETELHVVSLDTPTIRLDQSTNGGNQTSLWDLAANEASVFIREALTDTLPFRIRPGAPDNALYVAANGEVGMGIPDPRGALHIRRNQPNVLAPRVEDGPAR